VEHLLDLQDKIRKTSQAIGRLESEVVVRRDSQSLLANIVSLRKLHRNLQADFALAADELGIDVCHYRMLLDSPPAKALGSSIGAFQDAVSVIYESLVTGAKAKRTLTADTKRQTELRIAYSYPGSFGLALTIPNERFLFPDMRTKLDNAVEKVFDLGKAGENRALISKTVQELGRAPIVAIHDWAKANVSYEVGASIVWKKGTETSSEVLIQAPEFSALYDTLERIGETKQEEIVVSGILVGADADTKSFHFFIDGSKQGIWGKFTDAISSQEQARIPERYLARLHKTTETSFATEEEKVSYLLMRLEKP
jgi:hypothetical protein